MGTRLIKLEDGTLVEVVVSESEVQEISGDLAKKVKSSFSKVKPLLEAACEPVAQAVSEMRDKLEFEQVEIELGLSFESEGNLYITRAQLGANILIRMTLKHA